MTDYFLVNHLFGLYTYFCEAAGELLSITASIRERPLRATWATIAAPTLPEPAVRKPKLLFVTEGGFSSEWSVQLPNMDMCGFDSSGIHPLCTFTATSEIETQN